MANMSKSYVPGKDADAIIARQVAKGNFPSAEAVVRAGVRMLEEYEADLVRLRAKIDAADAAYQHGDFRRPRGAEDMKADLISRGEQRSRRKT
jgi:antitoxin ParD1/3/4